MIVFYVSLTWGGFTICRDGISTSNSITSHRTRRLITCLSTRSGVLARSLLNRSFSPRPNSIGCTFISSYTHMLRVPGVLLTYRVWAGRFRTSCLPCDYDLIHGEYCAGCLCRKLDRPMFGHQKVENALLSRVQNSCVIVALAQKVY